MYDYENEYVSEWVKEMGGLNIFFSPKPVYTVVNCYIGNCDWKWLSSVNYGGGYWYIIYLNNINVWDLTALTVLDIFINKDH